ncbi:MAG: hypothetical protein U0T83_01225 [Bacteriovoracaceae bacterium]
MFFNDIYVDLGHYTINTSVQNFIYKPYLRHLNESLNKIRKISDKGNVECMQTIKFNWKQPFKILKRKIRKSDNRYLRSDFI